MQYKFFTIPYHNPEESVAELNRFLAGHRILTVDRQFIPNGSNSAWALCVAFDSGEATVAARLGPTARRGKVDFKDILSDPEFAVFARLRALRKERSDAEGVPAYALFTNEQLAEMVQKRASSLTALREIAGVGEARAAKYGEAFLAILQEAALPAPAVRET